MILRASRMILRSCPYFAFIYITAAALRLGFCVGVLVLTWLFFQREKRAQNQEKKTHTLFLRFWPQKTLFPAKNREKGSIKIKNILKRSKLSESTNYNEAEDSSKRPSLSISVSLSLPYFPSRFCSCMFFCFARFEFSWAFLLFSGSGKLLVSLICCLIWFH